MGTGSNQRPPKARRAVALAVALLATVILAPVSTAFANHNDEIAGSAALTPAPFDLSIGDGLSQNATADVEQGEPRTRRGPGTCGGRKMQSTLWFRIIGNGGIISIVAQSNFNVMLAAYVAPAPTLGTGLPCGISDDRSASVSFQSQPGQAYLIQVGGCYECGGRNGGPTGDVVLTGSVTAGSTPSPAPYGLPSDGAPGAGHGCPSLVGNLSNGCPLDAQVRGQWRLNDLFSQLKSLTVRTRIGSRIELRCRCKKGNRRFVIAKTKKSKTNLTRYFRGGRYFRAGRTITVRVTRPPQLGTYEQLYTRTGRRLPRVTNRCLSASNDIQLCP